MSLAQRWREVLTGVDPEPWVEFLLYSHPALEKRIAMAKRFQQESNYSS